MSISREEGVLSGSECFYPLISPLAQECFFYITRIGHYICDTKYYLSDDSAIAQLEGHQNYFLLFVKRGQLNIENNGESFRALSGQVGLVNCRLPHIYYAAQPLEYFWMHFDGVMARYFFQKIIEVHKGCQVFYPESAEQIKQEYCQILTQLRQDSLSEVDATQHIYRMLCHLLCGSPGEISTSSNDLGLTAVQFINENYKTDLSVEDVAAHVNLSYSYFSRRFKAFSGHTVHEYLTIRRISEAKLLLATTDMLVKEIAVATGYHSVSSFVVSFVSKCSCTPSEYRRLNSRPNKVPNRKQ